jgi:hypothetical protein
MKEESEASAVWSKYVAAKKSAFGEAKESVEPLSLEQLEAAIAEAAASSGLPEIGMPPRSVVHPVKRSQLSRWFYLSLVVIFSSIVIVLVWWGREHHNSVNQ